MFYIEIQKIIFKLSLVPLRIWSTEIYPRRYVYFNVVCLAD